ncbi:MAG: 4-alpha-glucanotransferase [Candidatus Raymondbacteria bacterium RifOxyA12_full_50_37]|nr:MAG: 4-alpha-glucanotransferase [Candidatus Raymondbacteria bacterium RIFOXYA2_FULL_49_16]OGJ91857.1 MAG: 4-alpha-glucanotransferase [Candidatus Raymondbacteria bacterium RifOxyA12_full_50_37]OGK06946.1 MAG: 4-alpha-glucanotransferase [Candidatus Raymondbacteria bacterium RifOxyC12_full_50_8]OGP39659.1 MAG: 4-alpha-glucanotransferase [Candidatus Raymondbacteria bacterium RIFOXYB2_FULL_49_35]
MEKRSSGVLLHLSSLPSRHGIGDMGPAAYGFADMLARAGQSVWQVLPLGPTNAGCGHSPYFSASAFAGNPLLISLDELEKQGLLDPGAIALPRFSEGAVDYESVKEYKTAALDAAYARFKKSAQRGPFDRFCRDQKAWLDDFALFSVCSRLYTGAVWSDWPGELRERRASALTILREKEAALLEKTKFFQFLFFTQWAALKKHCNSRGIRILGDLPIYVSYNSADVWVHQDLFKLDAQGRPLAVSGVPPDYFSATGQLWNNPVYRWPEMRRTGFAWWLERVAALFGKFDYVRIDHFRGLVQYWEVPAGEATAINGSWQDVPSYEFFDALKQRFPSFPVIAEDLGTITDDVIAVKNHYGLPGMKVLIFGFSEHDPDSPHLPHRYKENCVAYTGTHDNNTVRGWFENDASQENKWKFFGYAGKEVTAADAPWEMVRMVMESRASLAIVPVQDLCCLPGSARMNNPAQTFGNWTWRLTGDQFDAMPVARLRERTRATGRA